MNDKTRIFVFLFGCILTRLLIALYAKNASIEHLKLLGYVGLCIGLGFAIIYLFKLRDTGLEAGGPIWWDNLRPVHSALWLIFATLAISGDKNAWIFLLIDVILGLSVWINHRVLNN